MSFSTIPKFTVAWNLKIDGIQKESPIQGCHFQVNHLKLWEGSKAKVLHFDMALLLSFYRCSCGAQSRPPGCQSSSQRGDLFFGRPHGGGPIYIYIDICVSTYIQLDIIQKLPILR